MQDLPGENTGKETWLEVRPLTSTNIGLFCVGMELIDFFDEFSPEFVDFHLIFESVEETIEQFFHFARCYENRFGPPDAIFQFYFV